MTTMIAETIDVRPEDASASGVSMEAASTISSESPVTALFAIPRDELDYWSFTWKRDEEESRLAREAGDSVVFDSDDPNDAVRWLLSDEN